MKRCFTLICLLSVVPVIGGTLSISEAPAPAFVDCESVTNAPIPVEMLQQTRIFTGEISLLATPSSMVEVAFGTSRNGDRPQCSAEVTEYYNPSLLWFDDAEKLGYGVVRPRSFFGSSFRVGPNGSQHPDLCRVVRLKLGPGESWWTDSEPELPLYGCAGEASAAPWETMARDISARAEVRIH